MDVIRMCLNWHFSEALELSLVSTEDQICHLADRHRGLAMIEEAAEAVSAEDTGVAAWVVDPLVLTKLRWDFKKAEEDFEVEVVLAEAEDLCAAVRVTAEAAEFALNLKWSHRVLIEKCLKIDTVNSYRIVFEVCDLM